MGAHSRKPASNQVYGSIRFSLKHHPKTAQNVTLRRGGGAVTILISDSATVSQWTNDDCVNADVGDPGARGDSGGP